MALPKSVQKQVDLANKIAEEMKNPPPDPNAPPPDPNTPPPPPPDPNAPPPDPNAPPPPPPPPPDESSEHKYKVLQGKYNAEVPRLQSENRELKEMVQELRQRANNTEALLAAMQTRATPAAPPPRKEPLVREEEIKEFGSDLYDFIKRVSKETVTPDIDARMKPVQDRFKQVEESTSLSREAMARLARQRVYDELAAAVPNWDEINHNEKFLEWLGEKDPYTGQRRDAILAQAFKAHDAPRVIAFFTGFQNENAAVQTPAPATPAVPSEPQRKLDDYVAPGTPKTGPASAPHEGGKRIWTRADVAEFYSRKNVIVRTGKEIPKEMQALERDLIKAQGEGRLR